jgi:hypothetical protein
MSSSGRRSTQSSSGLPEGMHGPSTAAPPASRQAFGDQSMSAPRSSGRKEHHVSLFKLRAGLLGMLAMLMVSMFTAAAASANLGPYCYHRALNGQGKGEKIAEQKPEGYQGQGATQVLEGKLGGGEIVIEAPRVQVKGVLYNKAVQCQTKILLKYEEPKLIKPVLPGCEVKVGMNNEVELAGHLVWKYQGIEKELKEQPQQNQKPDWLFNHNQINDEKAELPKESFTEITLGPEKACGALLTGKFKVSGNVGGETDADIGIWHTQEAITVNKLWQHRPIVNAKGEFVEYSPFKTELTFAGSEATYKGATKICTTGWQQNPKQEIAFWEV